MELMTVPEVAQVLRVPTARAYQLARDGLIPSVRVGRQVRVDRDALKEWARGGGRPLDHERGVAAAHGAGD